MSLAIAHFSVGAAMTTLLITVFFPEIPYPRTVIVFGGGWALIPDIQKISPVGQDRLYTFHESHWADVFWFHRTVDVIDSGDTELFAAGALAVFIVITMISERYMRRSRHDRD